MSAKSKTITFEDDVVVKKYKGDTLKRLDDNWLWHYNELREINPALVEIISISADDKVMIMKNVPHVNLEDNFKKKHVYQIIQLIKDMLELADVTDFIHTDFNTHNIKVRKDNDDIVLLDPDGFKFYQHEAKTSNINDQWLFRTQLEFNSLMSSLLKRWFHKHEEEFS